jgi:RecD/TraA family predicted helicase
MENFILNKLLQIQNTDNLWELNYSIFFKAMNIVTKQQGFYLSDEQIEAVRSVAEKNITIISGKAGVGKTSVIKAILEVYKDHRIGMAALSAKAAKRMREVTGFDNAQTIHRLLAYNGIMFEYNENCPLPYDLLILDECSMNNIYLFNSILKAVKNNTKIVMAGDFCQLASIGVGSVFADLVKNPVFNNHSLTQVYRQSETSYINEHANIVREGIIPFDITKGIMPFGSDIIYVFRNKSEEIANTAVNLYLQYLQDTNIEDITIVVPRKDTVCVSCEKINNMIQNRLLKDEKRFITYQDKVFKVGARIINKKNDYDKGILNGELGCVIFAIDNKIIVKFDEGNIVEFKNSELNNIELGYAISVHSSQGSQYKKTIVAMDMSSYTLLTSNMIYTAMTRASEQLIVVSQPSAFKKSVTNVQEHYRNTFLKYFLSKVDVDKINMTIKDNVKNHNCIYDNNTNNIYMHDKNNFIIDEDLPF